MLVDICLTPYEARVIGCLVTILPLDEAAHATTPLLESCMLPPPGVFTQPRPIAAD